jgi:TDG/mug DNA glycosylase family protein
MGEEVETLADLLRPALRAVVVGINPSTVSVEAGHYYQGTLGKLLWRRLRAAGLLSEDARPGREDDDAFAAGIGFTDIVKRPSARAHSLTAAEFAHGREALHAKLAEAEPGLVIFTYKKTATVLGGQFAGHGFVPGFAVAGIPAFVMPGPYAKADVAAAGIAELREWAVSSGAGPGRRGA